jgi:hypothetical protein
MGIQWPALAFPHHSPDAIAEHYPSLVLDVRSNPPFFFPDTRRPSPDNCPSRLDLESITEEILSHLLPEPDLDSDGGLRPKDISRKRIDDRLQTLLLARS